MNKYSKPSERRQFGRRWTNVHGWVCVGGRERVPCIVRNLSESGALLELEAPSSLPTSFRLEIESIGFSIGCEVERVRQSSVGVAFANAGQLGSKSETQSLYELLRNTTVWTEKPVCRETVGSD